MPLSCSPECVPPCAVCTAVLWCEALVSCQKPVGHVMRVGVLGLVRAGLVVNLWSGWQKVWWVLRCVGLTWVGGGV